MRCEGVAGWGHPAYRGTGGVDGDIQQAAEKHSESWLEMRGGVVYGMIGFGRAENRLRRKPGEESPNSTGRDAT